MDHREIGIRFPTASEILSVNICFSTIHTCAQFVTLTLSQGIERPEWEANHYTPSRAEVKNAWSVLLFPHMFSWR